MAEEESSKDQTNDMTETYLKISELRLQALEREYQETIQADNKLNEIPDNYELKGNFEQEKINNIQFINSTQNEKNEPQQQEENEEENNNKDQYQQIQDDEEGEENENTELKDDNWGQFQNSSNNQEIPAVIIEKEEPKLDVELIKSIMAKIDIQPPEWAKDQTIWDQKLKQMFGQKLN